MTKDPLAQSIQDYLKHIFELSAGGVPASTNNLAARLGVRPASVTGMVQALPFMRNLFFSCAILNP